MYLLDTNHCSLIFLKNQTVLDYIQEVEIREEVIFK
jgi:tRNA(fMet)-specific endonuclease VapC